MTERTYPADSYNVQQTLATIVMARPVKQNSTGVGCRRFLSLASECGGRAAMTTVGKTMDDITDGTKSALFSLRSLINDIALFQTCLAWAAVAARAARQRLLRVVAGECVG